MLYERGYIISIGRQTGVGIESIVYFGLTPKDEEVILKFHRVGFTSFLHVKKKRRYTANKHHISELYSSRLSAETEYKWLKVANDSKLSVPKVYGKNRHVIVMELIDGIDLNKLSKIPDPGETFETILDFIDDAWNIGKFVHGDLSEHNIIMTHDAIPIIIDFPQSVSIEMVEAKVLLQRDIKNVLTYFDRKFGIKIDEKNVLSKVIRE